MTAWFSPWVLGALAGVMALGGAMEVAAASPVAVPAASVPSPLSTSSVEGAMTAAQPMMGSLAVVPPAVGPHGGRVKVTATLLGASGCRLKMSSRQSFPVVYPHGPLPCSHAFSADVTVGANPSPVDRVITLQLVVNTGSGEEESPVRIGVLDASRTPLTEQLASSDWSGYAVQGGPFERASGTFTVPAATPASCKQALGEWVGVDGVSDQDLLQAGISEAPDAMSGSCAGQPTLQAWWEVLPSAEQPITMNVHPGDTMTISLSQTGPDQWEISVVDDTTGARFVHLEPYNGPAASVDWIMESPSTTGGTVTALMPYGQANFTNLRVDHSNFVTMIDELVLVQGRLVSAPEGDVSLSTLLRQGFHVFYTG